MSDLFTEEDKRKVSIRLRLFLSHIDDEGEEKNATDFLRSNEEGETSALVSTYMKLIMLGCTCVLILGIEVK